MSTPSPSQTLQPQLPLIGTSVLRPRAQVKAAKSLSAIRSNRDSSAATSLYIAESITPDYFGLLVTGKIYEPLSYVVFKTVATPESIGGGVIWDLRVEVIFSVTITASTDHDDGFLIVTCGDIPVNFTADPAGNVKGSLLGNMRPCEYLFREEYKDTSF